MLKKYLRRYNKAFSDVSYSIFAYALPSVALYFVVQPVIARNIPGEDNGTFLTLLSVIRYVTNILISSLATLRLMEKINCNKTPELNDKFNSLFVIALVVGVSISAVVAWLYTDSFDPLNIGLSLLFLVLLFFHDFYSIIFRINIDFKKLSIDNALIVVGYLVGLLLFHYTKIWQVVFIAGYAVGSIYVFIQARGYMHIGSVKRLGKSEINKKYVELSASNGLAYSSVYSDKLIVYPVLGGCCVSIYNAAGVVSKIISVVGMPIGNVILSYLVNKQELVLKKKPLVFFR